MQKAGSVTVVTPYDQPKIAVGSGVLVKVLEEISTV
jgi:hypothetical protein